MDSLERPTSPEKLKAELQQPHQDFTRSFAIEVFGEEEKARRWMNAPREIFEGKSPQQLLDTGDDPQLRRVLQVLIRIDYGVFS